ncbi:MAG: rhodanese-like domain-containing protein [Nitrospirae bacterium]|nr:rhodanese-like domain-containing protein [Nitrospirota bacterium]
MRILRILIVLCVMAVMALPAYANDAELAAKINTVLSKGQENGNYLVGADDVYMWIKMKKTDFQVVDVRVPADANMFKAGHIPGAIYIPYDEIAKPENLKKLPKDKKIVLVCHAGMTEILPLVPLRLLGYDAYAMILGMSGWQKDYPAAEWLKGILEAPKTKNYPIESGQ